MTPRQARRHWRSGLLVLLGLAMLGATLTSLRIRRTQQRVLIAPVVQPPDPNGYDLLLEAAALVPRGTVTGDERLPLAEHRRIVAAHTAALAKMREAFAYPSLAAPRRSYATRFPDYSRWRNLARVLVHEAMVRRADGDAAGAVASALDGIQLGTQLMPGAPIHGGQVGTSAIVVSDGNLMRHLDTLSAAEGRAAAQRLEQVRHRLVPFHDQLTSEKWFSLEAHRENMDHPDWTVNKLRYLFEHDDTGFGLSFRSRLRLALSSKHQLLHRLADDFDAQIQVARQPYRPDLRYPPPRSALGEWYLELTPMLSTKWRWIEAELAALTTALALHAWQRTHGVYPDTLSALVPDPLPAVPEDPFSPGRPLAYRSDGESYTLYSRGLDADDDHGQPMQNVSKTGRVRYNAGAVDWSDDAPLPDGDLVLGLNLAYQAERDPHATTTPQSP